MEKDLIILFLALLMVMCYVAVLFKALFFTKNGILISGDLFPKPQNDKQNDGYECELNFNRALKYFIGRDDYLISNVVLKNKKETVGEIDSILISRKGIFCIEIKNTRGSGKGRETTLHWKFRKKLDCKGYTRVENPVMQNARHIEIFEKLFEFNYFINNIVVFPNASNLKNISSDKVYRTDTFLKYFRSLKEDKLTKKEILKIVDRLCDYNATVLGFKSIKQLTKEQMHRFQLS